MEQGSQLHLSSDRIKQEIAAFLKNSGQNEKWLEGIIFSLNSNVLRISFIHPYFCSWFKNHAQAWFDENIKKLFPELDYAYNLEDENGNFQLFDAVKNIRKKRGMARDRQPKTESAANPFENYIGGEKNKATVALLKKIACHAQDIPAKVIFLGESGTGKTFLLGLLAKHFGTTGSACLFLPAVEFCKKLQSGFYQNFWKNYNILILDDMQELAASSAVISTLATCLDETAKFNEKRLIFCAFSTSQGTSLASFPPRLRSRLAGMLQLELKEADLETKLKYIEYANQSSQLGLSRAQIFSLARQPGGLSAIQGTLTKIKFLKSTLHGAAAESEVETLFNKSGSGEAPWNRLLEIVARHFHVRAENLTGPSRKADYVLPRQMGMYLCRKQLGLSFNEIGELFGGRDHSTVMHAIKKMQSLQEIDRETHNLLQELEKSCTFADTGNQ